METIEVRYTSLGNGSYYHKYLVYTDTNGNQLAARGGPSQNGGLSELGSAQSGTIASGAIDSPFGNIRTEVGVYDPDFSDYNPAGNEPSEIVLQGADLSPAWVEIVKAMNDIGNEQHLSLLEMFSSLGIHSFKGDC